MPSIYPAKDQYVASNSSVNVTFNCSAPIGSNPGWEINGSQIVGDDFVQRIARMGVLTYSESQYSLVIVTPMARLRPEYKVLSIECLSTHNETLFTENTENYSVITFGRFKIILSLLKLYICKSGKNNWWSVISTYILWRSNIMHVLFVKISDN